VSDEGRLSPAEAAEVLRRARPIPVERGASPVVPCDLVGVDLAGAPVSLHGAPAVEPLLLLFVSATCDGCLDLFAAAQRPTGALVGIGARVVLVLRSGDDPALDALVGTAEAVVSPQAWTDYRVDGAPFYSLVLPDRSTVATEGVAWGPEEVARSVVRGLAGELAVDVPRLEGP